MRRRRKPANGAQALATKLIHPGDPGAALALLTRLPAPFAAHRRGARAAWAWPLVGLVVAALAALAAGAAQALGLGPGPVAALALIVQALLTGGLHHDGLADVADGIWGGATPQHRLEIMRDSRVGSYGVLALVLGTLLAWSALSQIAAAGPLWPALLVAAALSRAAMACVMAALPHARGDGLSRLTGRPSVATAGLAVAAAGLAALLLVPGATAALLVAVAVASLAAGALARARLGGQTGDVLGAVQQMTEGAALLVLAAEAAG